MASNIELFLQEDWLKTDAIILEGPGHDDTPLSDFERIDNVGPVMIEVHRDTGKPLGIVIEGFVDDTNDAVLALRDNPLPWTFTLASMEIIEKPLEDVLLAIWKKYKGITMEWDE